MADVSISYKDSVIAEMDGTDTKTLKTGGTYCEGDISVSYTARIRDYEITLLKTEIGKATLLTTLDDDVLEHIHDAQFVATLINMDAYEYDDKSKRAIIISNTAVGLQSNTYPVYGVVTFQNTETAVMSQSVYYPADNTIATGGIGGLGRFILIDNEYYVNSDMQAGTYRLSFSW